MVGGFLIPWCCQIMLAQSLHAAEFYSWIDPNGTVVLTDDLSGLPPSLPRQSVWIYRYVDPPPSAAPSRPGRPAPRSAERAGDSQASLSPAPQTAKEPAPPGHAVDVLAAPEAPTGQLAMGQTLVLGVPLASPLQTGNRSLPLALLNRLPPGPEGLAQRLRELQALQARHFAPAPLSSKGRVAAGQARGTR